MQRVMARTFARQNQKDIPFVSQADAAHFGGCGGLAKDGQWLPDWGSTDHTLHWNGAKLLSAYVETLSATPQYWLHVQFQQPGYIDAGAFYNDPFAPATPARGMTFDTIEIWSGDGLTMLYGPLTLASATVTPSANTASGRGAYWEAKWQVFANSFVTSGATFILRIKDKGTAFAPPIVQSYAMGVNLSGMEWAQPGVRYGQSTYPNLNYTAPRLAMMQYLASQGVTVARLPINWELLQPTRASTPLISAATLAAYNTTSPAQTYAKAAFSEVYAQAIDKVLTDAQTANIKIIIDLHNDCRYSDFVYDGSGNVAGLVNPADDVTPPYTTDGTKVRGTIFANAGTSPTLPISDFTDFWTKAATRWKSFAALGGYSLMNEPHDMPTATTNTPWNNPFIGGNVQDYSIWPTYAQAAVNAIRAVDSTTPIYVGGNNWQNPIEWPTINPGFPLTGTGIIYDFHLYLDATNGGFRFDWDQEVAKAFSAGEGSAVISTATGTNRIKFITDWKAANGNPPLACTEFGLPIELRASDLSIDQRWLDAGKATIDTLFNNNIQVFSWMGGDHWPIRGYPLNHVPRFHQNQTVEPQVSAYMQAKLGTTHAVIFDEGPCYGTSVQTIKVVARGYLSAGVTLTVAADKGTLSKTTLTLAAGTNSQDTFTFTPPTDDKSTISYTRTGGGQVPPNRVFYSYTDPATKTGITAADAALAVVAKYGAALWLAQDAYTDYCSGVACTTNGDPMRAVSDKLGAASTIENPQEMVNWFNNETPTSIRGIFLAPTWTHDGDGFPAMDLTSGTKYGLYSKHLAPVNNPTSINPSGDNYPLPAAKALFDLTDSHFGVVTFKISTAGTSGVLAGAQEMQGAQHTVLQLNAGKVELDQFDVNSVEAKLADTTVQGLHAPCTASFVSTASAQKLRVNGVQVASGAHSWSAASPFSTLTWGGGHWNFFPVVGPQVHTHGCIFGKGSPRDDEMGVLEAYLKTFEYTPPVLAPWETLLQAYFTAGNAGFWGDNRALAEYLNGSDVPPAAANGTDLVKRWINHGNKTNGHDYLETTVNRAFLNKDAGNYIYLPGYSSAPIVSAGGGAMALCYGCIVVDWQGYYSTILSSMNAANVGIRIHQTADDDVFYFKAGTGSATVQASIPNGLPYFTTPVGKVVIEFFYDGAHLNISLNGGTPGQAAFTGNIAAGAADMSLFGHTDGTDTMGGNLYGLVWLPGVCPNSTDRTTIRKGLALAYDALVIS